MFKSDHKILILLISLTIIRGIIYIAIIPPWLGPDEVAHFEAIRLIGQKGQWPTEEVYRTTPMHPQMAASFDAFRIWQISGLIPPDINNPAQTLLINYYPPTSSGSLVFAGNYPLVYHILLAPLALLLSPLDIVSQLYLLRLVSLLMITITIISAWFFTNTIFPQSTYPLAVTSFMIFLPMYTYVNTLVNTDVFCTFLASLYFLVLAKIFCRGVLWWRWGAAFCLLVAAILVKPTALFLLPTSLAAVIVYLARSFRWKTSVLASLCMALMVLTFLGALLFYQLTNGGRLGSIPIFSVRTLNLFKVNYFSREAVAVYIHTIRWGFLSFWGLFGWANIPVSFNWLRVLWMICLAIGVGCVIFVEKYIISAKKVDLKYEQKSVLLVVLLALIFALIGVYVPIIATQSIKWGPPSRYLFPAILPLALYFFIGFQQLLPRRFHKFTLIIWLVVLVCFDSIVLIGALLPTIYV